MPTDPAGIPEHVMARVRRYDDETMAGGDTYLRGCIAAALDALCTGRVVVAGDMLAWNGVEYVLSLPDVLAAVLAHAKEKAP